MARKKAEPKEEKKAVHEGHAHHATQAMHHLKELHKMVKDGLRKPRMKSEKEVKSEAMRGRRGHK